MIHNYHTHTRRCNHAAGEDREYVEAAIKAGIKTLGFSDHSPYLFPKEAGSYYSSFRMRPEQLFDYVSSIESLRQEFKGQIRILTGVEIEYYPKSFPATEKFLRDSGVQYLLLGQHCFGEEYEKGAIFAAGHKNAARKELEDYTSLIVECIESGRFLYVAHPDIFNYPEDRDFYLEQSERVCLAAAKNNVPLEVNLLGYTEGRHYPRKDFWQVAGKAGVKAVFGIDAHRPAAILDADNQIERFKKEYEEFGIKFIDEELI